MTEEEQQKVKTTAGYGKTPRLSKKKQPLQPSPSREHSSSSKAGQSHRQLPGTLQIVQFQPPEVQSFEAYQATSVQSTAFQSSEVESDVISAGFRRQVPDGPGVDKGNNAGFRVNLVNQSFNPDVQKPRKEQSVSAKYTRHDSLLEIAPSQVSPAGSTHQAQSRSTPPRYPSPTEFQQLDPALGVNNSEGPPCDRPHLKVALNDKVDVIMHEFQQESDKNELEAAFEEWEADLKERDAELGSRETKLQMREARLQEIENVLQEWQTDLQERAAALDMRETAL